MSGLMRCIIDSKVHQINILLVRAIVKPRKPDTVKLLLSKAGEGGQGSYTTNGDTMVTEVTGY